MFSSAIRTVPHGVTAATQLDRDPFLEAGVLDLYLRARQGSDSTGDLAGYLEEFRQKRNDAFQRGLRVAVALVS